MSTAGEFGTRVGGRLCLDFVNTVRGRISRPARRGRDYADLVVGERLVSYDALLRWGVFAGAVSARTASELAREVAGRPAEAGAVLERAVTAREALYRILKTAIEGWPARAEDVATVDREIRTARAHETLVASPAFHWEWDDPRSPDRVLWPVMGSAAQLLTSAELERVGQCAGEQCGWLFVDTSRSRRRQWCDMAECGNVAKVRRFREKQRAAGINSAEGGRRERRGRRTEGP